MAVGALAFGSHAALALGPDPDEPSTTEDSSEGSSDAGESEDARTEPPASLPPPPSVTLEGGANGSIAALGEGWTTWRYGRSKANLPVDETTTRLRVSGSGRTFDGLLVGFSVGLLVPSLRAGAAISTTSLAAVWARQDRDDRAPEIEWDTSAADAGPSRVALTVTSISEADHTSDRHGGVTVDVTRYLLHGNLVATVPCARSSVALRQSCRQESIRGSF